MNSLSIIIKKNMVWYKFVIRDGLTLTAKSKKQLISDAMSLNLEGVKKSWFSKALSTDAEWRKKYWMGKIDEEATFLETVKLTEDTEHFTLDTIKELLSAYSNYRNTIGRLNSKLPCKKQIRNPNFPSEISENIVRLILDTKYDMRTTWNVKSGDLACGDLKLEVKAFTSKGPTSFGPTESWDRLYILDCTKYDVDKFICYEIPLSNTSKEWQNLEISKKNTFKDQSDAKKRPRITFEELQKHIKSIKEIFNGSLDDLLT